MPGVFFWDMAGDKVAIERPMVEAQSVYDEICEKRRSLNGHAKLRSEALENIPRFKQLSKEMATTRLSRKNVVADFDEKNPSHKRRIDAVKDELDALEAKLGGMALDHYRKTGTKLELKKKMRGGTEKKIQIGFAIRTLSLF